MGNFYVNTVIRDVEPQDVLLKLRERKRRAFVSPKLGRHVVVYDRACNTQDLREIEVFCELVSNDWPRSVVMTALNHDDDALVLLGYKAGSRVAEYDSSSVGRHGTVALCRCTGRWVLLPLVWLALQGPTVFAVFRHMLVYRLLGLPVGATCMGYESIRDGEVMGVEADSLLSTDTDPSPDSSSSSFS